MGVHNRNTFLCGVSKSRLKVLFVVGTSFSRDAMKTKPKVPMKASSIFFLTLLTYFLGISTIAAADVSHISGSLIDQNGNPIPRANVALISTSGGGLVDGTVSDDRGNFLSEALKTGEAYLAVPIF